jgi:hypothetical protein
VDLRDLMRRHARGPLVRLTHHGETAVYTPAGGDPIDVDVVVDRKDVEPAIPGAPARAVRLTAHVFLPRGDGTTGVAAVNPGDTLTLPMRLGAAAKVARVVAILSQDEGGFLLEVKA